ncbi:hypothetical protein [Stenomitos frigidus]|uniref:Uncharacterized protein n=1 Tax=Stenomitos frigidus ULC18 TaxID=2107698 RepID=A0A2T1DTQ8_9CYAN|nr:hypothetical protein [Stenomitos frigidus]PSB23852.1 hypothetical protein C7B82_29150 [Stenomitos frigidus ULC18]
MAFFRQYIAPIFIFLIFFVALAAVSARIFLPSDMAAPAPVSEVSPQNVLEPSTESVAGLPPALAALVKGLPDDPALFQ